MDNPNLTTGDLFLAVKLALWLAKDINADSKEWCEWATRFMDNRAKDIPGASAAFTALNLNQSPELLVDKPRVQTAINATLAAIALLQARQNGAEGSWYVRGNISLYVRLAENCWMHYQADSK